MSYPVPINEKQRIEELRLYGILDTSPEDFFQAIVEEAAKITQCPVALLGFIDSERHWVKACFGIDVTEINREYSFCAHTIMRQKSLVVPDLSVESRFKNNPFVNVPDGMGLRFYAGVPIISPNGCAIGALCVADYSPGLVMVPQILRLVDLASKVVRKLEDKKHGRVEVLR